MNASARSDAGAVTPSRPAGRVPSPPAAEPPAAPARRRGDPVRQHPPPHRRAHGPLEGHERARLHVGRGRLRARRAGPASAAGGVAERTKGFSLTYLPFIVRAFCDAVATSRSSTRASKARRSSCTTTCNLGVAVDLEFRGLIAPGDPRRRRQAPAAHRPGDPRSRDPGPLQAARTGRDHRRHVHDHEHGSVRHVHDAADHQPAAGRDPRHRRDHEEAGGRRGSRR